MSAAGYGRLQSELELGNSGGEVPVGPSILNCDGDDQNDGGPPEMGRETLAWFVSMVSNE
jgi:hypothetical protein